MKLLICRVCEDVRKLGFETTFCKCKKSWGQYHDEVNASYGGKAISIGLANSSVVKACRAWLQDKGNYEITAFTIPADADSVTFEED